MYSSLIHLLLKSIYDLMNATQQSPHIKQTLKAKNIQKKSLLINFLQIAYFVKQNLLMLYYKFMNFRHN